MKSLTASMYVATLSMMQADTISASNAMQNWIKPIEKAKGHCLNFQG